VETFGFHLRRSICDQNADVHERVTAELLSVRSRRLYEPRRVHRVALLRRELASERLLASPFQLSRNFSNSIVRAAAEAHRRYGPGCITTYIVSKCANVVGPVGGHILLKEAGLYRGHGTPHAAIMPVPLFETIGDLQRAAEVMTAWLDLPEAFTIAQAHGFQEVMVGYSDFEQGRRISQRRCGACTRRPVAGCGVREIRHLDADFPCQ